MLNFANLITLSRIALTPIIVFFMLQQSWDTAGAIFLIAVLTDVLDGWIARKFHQYSKIGQILDPIADKILFVSVMATFAWLLVDHTLFFFMFCFLILKEIILLIGGAILWFGYTKFIQPSKLSRQVSWYEFLFLLLVMINQSNFFYVPVVLVWLVAILNILLSCKLLILYTRKIFNHADIS